VHGGLAGPLWTIVLAGAFLSIAMTWFFDLKSQSMHLWMTVMLAALLGLLIYLLAALDNPFRGDRLPGAISAYPFRRVAILNPMKQPRCRRRAVIGVWACGRFSSRPARSAGRS
jgi:hypothetical protein